MKKQMLAILAISISSLLFAQNQPFIEVAVDEVVELKAINVSYRLKVVSEYDQRENALYNYDEEYYYESEEDYYYEEMMAESPKKVTKEMKEAYQQRQLEREEKLAEQYRKEAEFQPYRVSDLMQVLDANAIAYEVKKDGGTLNELLDYEDYDEGNDSSLVINLTSEEAFDKLSSLIANLQVTTDVLKVTYEELNDMYEVAIPKITTKANKQANVLASSMQRKLGKVIQCTNVLPTGMSPNMVNQVLLNNYDRFSLSGASDSNPFNKTQKNYITFVYRYELLN